MLKYNLHRKMPYLIICQKYPWEYQHSACYDTRSTQTHFLEALSKHIDRFNFTFFYVSMHNPRPSLSLQSFVCCLFFFFKPPKLKSLARKVYCLPRTVNKLPTVLLSSAEDAEECVTRFTNLVRYRD